MTPLKAIRAKCLDCCCYQQAEVRRCPATECPLYAYRMGHNPARAGLGKKQDAPEEDAENPSSTTDF
jgi:hypothetical protein